MTDRIKPCPCCGVSLKPEALADAERQLNELRWRCINLSASAEVLCVASERSLGGPTPALEERLRFAIANARTVVHAPQSDSSGLPSVDLRLRETSGMLELLAEAERVAGSWETERRLRAAAAALRAGEPQ